MAIISIYFPNFAENLKIKNVTDKSYQQGASATTRLCHTPKRRYGLARQSRSTSGNQTNGAPTHRHRSAHSTARGLRGIDTPSQRSCA